MQKGFTLIETLVVIAIIGILATIIITSLGNAKTKAAETKVEAQLSQMRQQGQLFLTENHSYGSANTIDPTVYTTVDDPIYRCGAAGGGSIGPLFDDPTTLGLPDNLYKFIALVPPAYTTFCYTDPSGGGMGQATAWAVTAEAPTAEHISWCVDSAGNMKSYSGSTPSIDIVSAVCQ